MQPSAEPLSQASARGRGERGDCCPSAFRMGQAPSMVQGSVASRAFDKT